MRERVASSSLQVISIDHGWPTARGRRDGPTGCQRDRTEEI